MKVIDANFLIDYLNGDETTKTFYEANGGNAERWVMPVPAYAEALVGAGNLPEGDVEGARAALAWGEPHAVDAHTAVVAGEIAAEVGPEGPFLDGLDALIAAVGRELDAPVVSADSDLTHEATRQVIDIETYRK
ncbi:type II toxin-antitoxin system VapC family toxin [Halonotius terrestris]|uniref:Ribonuclease VapC n=1 Tax=Halonotius terrestris TaxID=2487750 RepID=A0A8J8P8M3_9EURY|nr:PIN domain-containing protein [Halonotius terrestris]TQQ81034.1 type II toxin-antitoxin system VapC family toxin [Halonotius terrestris]